MSASKRRRYPLFDLQRLLAIEADTDRPTELYALSPVSASVLSQLRDIVLWRNTRWDFDPADEAELVRLSGDIYEELSVPLHLDEIVQYIDEVEGLLRAIQDRANCCGQNDPSEGVLYTNAVTDGVGNVPQEIIDAGYATGASDWTGFAEYKCMIAHLMVESLETRTRELGQIVDGAGLIFGGLVAVLGIITGFVTLGAGWILTGIIASTITAAKLYDELSNTTGSALDTLANKVPTKIDALACAIYQADGSEAGITALNAAIDAEFTAVEATILKLLNNEATLRALYGGRYDAENVAQKLADAGYSVSGYACCPGDYLHINSTFDADAETWRIRTDSGGDGGVAEWSASYGGSIRQPTGSTASDFYLPRAQFYALAGLPDMTMVRLTEITVEIHNPATNGVTAQIDLEIRSPSGTVQRAKSVDAALTPGETTLITFDETAINLGLLNEYEIRIEHTKTSGSGGNYLYLKGVEIKGSDT